MNPTLQPPHSREAESGLVGSLIVSLEDFGDVIATGLEPDDFFLTGYRSAYKAIIDLYEDGKPIDPVILKDELVKRGAFGERFTLDQYADTIQTAPPSSHGPDYAKIIREHSIKRKMLGLSYTISKNTEKGIPLNGELEELALLSKSLEGPTKGDWRKKLKTKLVDAADLQHLIDKPVPYLIKPLVVEGSLTQIQGIPKGGKSAFALYLSICASENIWPNPEFLSADNPIQVLYISWEDPDLMMAKRISLYQAGLGKDRLEMPKNIKFLFAPTLFIDREDHAEALMEAIDEINPRIVVFDTLSHTHSAENENSATEMRIPMAKMYQVAQAKKVGIVYIHHTAKNSGDRNTQEKSRGSVAIAAAWHVLLDWGVREEGSNVNPIKIQSKYEHRSMEWSISYLTKEDRNNAVCAVEWSIQEKEERVGKESSMERKRRVLKETVVRLTLIKPWVGAHEVTNECNLGLEEKAVRSNLSKLCQDGELRSSVGKNRELLFCPNGPSITSS